MTASTPPRIDVGLIQLVHGSPATPPAGTRPDAIAPATAPMQNGTSTEDIANAAPKLRWSRVRNTALRKAKLDPRSTIPSAARVSGTNSVSMIDANASENAVHSTTRMKINQTWFASHTGPIEWSIERTRPLAPLGAAGDEVPEPGAEVGAAEERVGGDADEQHDGDGVGSSSGADLLGLSAPSPGGGGARAVRHVGLVDVARVPRSRKRGSCPAARGSSSPDHEVERDDHEERDPHARVPGRGVLDLHVVRARSTVGARPR